MAIIRKRPSGYSVVIRKAGFPTVSRTLKTLTAARAYVRDTEYAMDHGLWAKAPDAGLTTVDQVIDRFITEVSSARPLGRSKLHSLRLTSRAFKGVKVQDLSPHDVMEFGKERRAEIAKSTLQQQPTFFAQAIDMGRTLWGLDLKDNPVPDFATWPVQWTQSQDAAPATAHWARVLPCCRSHADWGSILASHRPVAEPVW